MKRYEVTEEQIRTIANHGWYTDFKEIPEGTVYPTRERFEEVTRKYWNGSLPLAVVYILDEIFGNPSFTENP